MGICYFFLCSSPNFHVAAFTLEAQVAQRGKKDLSSSAV